MKISFEGTGTAEEVAQLALESQDQHELDAAGNEKSTIGAAFNGVFGVLEKAPQDGQATVKMYGEVRGTELVHLYVDLTVVPSAAIQEARAASANAAEAAKVRPGAPSVASV